jgi:hypothetical protein
MRQFTIYGKDDRTDACVALYSVYVTNGKTLVRALDAKREPVARRMAAALNAARRCGILLEPLGAECLQAPGVAPAPADAAEITEGDWLPAPATR